MKYFLTAVFLFTTSILAAQIVNIPDPAFKSALLSHYPRIDTNYDGQIQVSEAAAVTRLTIITGNFTNITGIQSFVNLDTATIENSTLSPATLDFSGMASLRSLQLAIYTGRTIIVSGCTNLETLDLQRTRSISTLDITGANKIKYIRCGQLTTSTLDLHHCDSLFYFRTDDWNSQIDTLNISGLTMLETLNVSGFFRHVNARNNTGLVTITNNNTGWGSITQKLDVTGCINLVNFLADCHADTMDFSTCINLQSLSFRSTHTRYLNLKNGRIQSIQAQISDIARRFKVCTDDLETSSVATSLISQNPTVSDSIFVSSFCSNQPGGNYNTIHGKVSFNPSSNNCTPGNRGMPNVPMNIQDGAGGSVTRYSMLSGEYDHYTYAGNFSVTPFFFYPYYTLNPTSTQIVFDTANNLIDTANYCISGNGSHNELDITYLPITNARPGFYPQYKLYIRNRGTTTLSGNITLNFDNSRMNYFSSSQVPTSQSPGQLQWDYTNIQPFEVRYVNLVFSLPPPPVNNLGDTLNFLAVVNPLLNDETPADNSYMLSQEVNGAFDPNDKECLQGEKISIADAEKFLDYMIRFQNLGTDTAFNVYITDTLSNKFDWSNFDITAASHPFTAQRKDNKLEFVFENIQLPHAGINEPASHGFIAFKIKPQLPVAIGDSLTNKASIYFDFNLPVVTNLATTVITTVAPLPVRLEYFTGVRKDNANLLSWKAPCTNGLATFELQRSSDARQFTPITTLSATSLRCQLPFYYNDALPQAGKNFYRLKITDENGNSIFSKVVALENNQPEIRITSVFLEGGNAEINVNAAVQQTVVVKLLSADGKTHYTGNKLLLAGSNKIYLPLRQAAKGIYMVVIYVEDGNIVSTRFFR